MLGLRAAAKRDKHWVWGMPSSGINAGFLSGCQAGQILGSWAAAKRDKRWVCGGAAKRDKHGVCG